MYNFNCLCKLWIWCTTKIKIKKNKNHHQKKLSLELLSLEPIPSVVLSTVLHCTLGLFVLNGYTIQCIAAKQGIVFRVVTISLFRGCFLGLWSLIKSSLHLHNYIFGMNIFSKFSFHVSQFKSWLKSVYMLNEMNQDYEIPSLGLTRIRKWTMFPTAHTLFQCKPREVISHFKTLLPLVVTAKSVKVQDL